MVLGISIQWFGKTDDIERFDSVGQGLPAVNSELNNTDENEGIPLPTDSE